MSCCSASQPDLTQLTVHDCFERGLATRRRPALVVAGERISGANGLWVTFSLQADRCDCLTDIRFDASSCTTLIAYCQALADIHRGRPMVQALQYSTHALAAAVQGVPAAKYDRAILASAALRAAVMATPAFLPTLSQADSQWEKPDESRLHLRHAETHRVLRTGTHDPAAA